MAKKKAVKLPALSNGKLRKPVSARRRRTILEKTSGRCHLCGRVLQDGWQVDHVKTFHSGGECIDENLLAICSHCNLRRRGRGPKRMRRMLEIGHYMELEVNQNTELGKAVAERVRERKRAAKARRVPKP